MGKDEICHNPEKSTKVLTMYNEWFEDHKVKTNCSQPCYFVSIAVSKTREQIYKENVIKFYVVFEKFIKVNKAYYLHSAMSIISSVGGFINIWFFETLTVKSIKQILKLVKAFYLLIISPAKNNHYL